MSRIIKSHLTDPAVKIIEVTSLINHQEESVERAAIEPLNLLKEAERKAEMLIKEASEYGVRLEEELANKQKEWEKEKTILIEEIRRKGYQEGFDKGIQDGQQQYTGQLDHVREIIDSAKTDYRQTIVEAEKEILHLSIQIAAKIIAFELEKNQEYYLSFVKNAIKEVKEYEDIELHIHPMHYHLVSENKDSLRKLIKRESDLFIYPNEKLEINGCIIESSNGKLVAGVDDQLSQIKQALLQSMEEHLL